MNDLFDDTLWKENVIPEAQRKEMNDWYTWAIEELLSGEELQYVVRKLRNVYKNIWLSTL